MRVCAAVILAAGTATRYRAAGGAHPTKLLERWHGEPMVRQITVQALRSRAAPIIVVTGHAARDIEAALRDLPIRIAHNPKFADGMAMSLRCGIDAVPAQCPGAVVLLGDMPGITADTVNMLLDRAAGADIDAVVPVHGQQRGNPVVLNRRLFPAIGALTGDTGARKLLSDPGLRVLEVPFDARAVLDDLDLPPTT